MTPNTSGSITLGSSYDLLSYVKIGNLVHIQGRVYIDSVSSPSGSYITVAGFPFANMGANESAEKTFIMVQTHGINNGGDGPVWVELTGSQSAGSLHRTRDNNSWTYIDPDNFGGNTYMMFNGTYRTDS